jgi:hypothetical protein
MFEKEKKENFNCIYDRAVKIATVEKKGTNKMRIGNGVNFFFYFYFLLFPITANDSRLKTLPRRFGFERSDSIRVKLHHCAKLSKYQMKVYFIDLHILSILGVVA